MAEIKLKSGEICLIDDEDFNRISEFKWYLTKGKYARGYIKGDKMRFMHRFILSISDPKIMIDHKNRNGLDNRKENLRICTSKQNHSNVEKYKGTSKYKGVSWDKKSNKWKASLTTDNKSRHLGFFVDEVEAAKAYDSAAIEIFKEYSCINFSEQALKQK